MVADGLGASANILGIRHQYQRGNNAKTVRDGSL
jgi:hypothetical protein